MAHDDGQLPQDLNTADIILLGISRTSKTPTSIYLAQRGYKTANLPLVPGIELPPALAEPHQGLRRRPGRQPRAHRRDPPQPRADAGRPQPRRIRRPHTDRQRAHLFAPAVRPARLACHRRDAPLHRGDGGDHHPAAARPRGGGQHRGPAGDRAMAEPAPPAGSSWHRRARSAAACWKPRACPSRWGRRMSTRRRSSVICSGPDRRLSAIAEALAAAKAEAVSARLPDALVIGADQVLALGPRLVQQACRHGRKRASNSCACAGNRTSSTRLLALAPVEKLCGPMWKPPALTMRPFSRGVPGRLSGGPPAIASPHRRRLRDRGPRHPAVRAHRRRPLHHRRPAAAAAPGRAQGARSDRRMMPGQASRRASSAGRWPIRARR